MPEQEFDLDVILRVGQLRYREHRSCTDIHAQHEQEGVSLALRTTQNLLAHYDLLVTLALETLPERATQLTGAGTRHPGHRWVAARCRPRSIVGDAGRPVGDHPVRPQPALVGKRRTARAHRGYRRGAAGTGSGSALPWAKQPAQCSCASLAGPAAPPLPVPLPARSG